jgi:hypothetical protein
MSTKAPRSTTVKRHKNPLIPVHDYRSALQSAVSWLGERYVLAEPAQRRSEERKPFFSEIRSWLPPTRR